MVFFVVEFDRKALFIEEELRERMKTCTLLFAAATVGSANAFVSNNRPTWVSSSKTELFGGSSGYATTLEGKKERVATIKGLLDTSEMIFSIPSDSLTVAQVQQLRKSLPEGTTMSVVKNKLMNIAVEGTPYEAAQESLLKGNNMWFFIEDDIGGSIDAYKSFIKEANKKETHGVSGGVVEGVVYDAAGIEAISKLPSKLELIARVAGGIKAVPTKLARVVKQPGTKMARAIKLATEQEQE